MVDHKQIRAAMGLLGWEGKELAERAGVRPNTVSRAINGGDVLVSTLRKLQQALEEGGVEFIPGGVRLRQRE
ncbi:MAG: helix-turn-helix domain-containing protein [Proteobacteria bacterium]|nr:helix-turn-helix domain-containing protein [Pseudomonadota bacterium]